MRCIVGLGNPGKEYEMTRHNMGRIVVQSFAQKVGCTFSYKDRFEAFLGKITLNDEEVYFLLPETYMNESGISVSKFMHYYKLPLEGLLVVSDDADIEFGVLRERPDGSSGGHNGLKSIENSLGTQKYNRLRCGIGRNMNDLKDHVLSRFSKEEDEKLPKIILEACECIERFIEKN